MPDFHYVSFHVHFQFYLLWEAFLHLLSLFGTLEHLFTSFYIFLEVEGTLNLIWSNSLDMCGNRAPRHAGPSHGWLYSVQDTAWKSSLLCSFPWTRPPPKVDSQLHHYQLSSNSSDGCMDMLVNINDHSRDSYNLKNIVELPGEDYLCLTGFFCKLRYSRNIYSEMHLYLWL